MLPSSGERRQTSIPGGSFADWRRTISYLEARPEVDPTRIGARELTSNSQASITGLEAGALGTLVSSGFFTASR
jgi:hypothetical protein